MTEEADRWAGTTREELRERWSRDSVHLFGSVDSTNERAKELAESGAPAGTVVLAREQTAGKGRAGRNWHSPPDTGVYMSVLFRPDRIENPVLLQLLAGLGVAAELDADFEGLDPAVKWPNDLIADDRKFGGVLSEASWEEDTPQHLIVGVGINVRTPEDLPAELQGGATSMQEVLDDEVPLLHVADAVLRGLEERLVEPPRSLDEPSLDLLDRYDWLRDRRVDVQPEDEDEFLDGVCVGMAPDGALLFRPDRGALRRLHSATVRVPEW